MKMNIKKYINLKNTGKIAVIALVWANFNNCKHTPRMINLAELRKKYEAISNHQRKNNQQKKENHLNIRENNRIINNIENFNEKNKNLYNKIMNKDRDNKDINIPLQIPKQHEKLQKANKNHIQQNKKDDFFYISLWPEKFNNRNPEGKNLNQNKMNLKKYDYEIQKKYNDELLKNDEILKKEIYEAKDLSVNEYKLKVEYNDKAEQFNEIEKIEKNKPNFIFVKRKNIEKNSSDNEINRQIDEIQKNLEESKEIRKNKKLNLEKRLQIIDEELVKINQMRNNINNKIEKKLHGRKDLKILPEKPIEPFNFNEEKIPLDFLNLRTEELYSNKQENEVNLDNILNKKFSPEEIENEIIPKNDLFQEQEILDILNKKNKEQNIVKNKTIRKIKPVLKNKNNGVIKKNPKQNEKKSFLNIFDIKNKVKINRKLIDNKEQKPTLMELIKEFKKINK